MPLAMPVRIESERARRALTSLGRKFETRRILKAIGASQLNWINRNFRAGGIERKWKPLSPNTLASRRGRGGQPLRDTGRLAQSFTATLDGSDAVIVGTTDKRAPWHHFGTRAYTIRPRNRTVLRFMTSRGVTFARKVEHPGLPARPLLPSKREAERLAVKSIRAFADKAIRETGLG